MISHLQSYVVAVDLPLRKDHVEPSFIIFNRLICLKNIILMIKSMRFSLKFWEREEGKMSILFTG